MSARYVFGLAATALVLATALLLNPDVSAGVETWMWLSLVVVFGLLLLTLCRLLAPQPLDVEPVPDPYRVTR